MPKTVIFINIMISNQKEINMNNAHEFVIFKFKAGISIDEQTNLMSKIDDCAKPMAGFMSREYFYSEENEQWIDHVVWSDINSAKSAAEAIMSNPVAGEVFMNIDESTVSMSHYQKHS